MSDNILASGISQKEHLAVFDQIASLRFAALEIEKVLLYVIDTADADALYFLAEQFDVLGYKGWKLASNESERRALVKKAVLLHRYKGTIYGIKEALSSVGFGSRIQEHINYLYDSSIDHDGANQYGADEWATFRVILDLGNDKGMSTSQTADVIALINEYKNVRSHLMGISWEANLNDSVNISEDFQITMILSDDVDNVSGGIYYNGIGSYDGTYIHYGLTDSLEVVEIT